MIKDIFACKVLCRGMFILLGCFLWMSTLEYTDAACTTTGADYNAAYNHYDGRYNAPNYPNAFAFAALKSDGSITAWGDSAYGGNGEPTDTGYTKIYSNGYAFAAMKSDGSITAWGHGNYGGSGAPTDTGYTQISSTYGAFAAMKSDGSITA
ncbi:MAG: hypothetical protein CR972_05210 [Candidatus Moraniibacteriota bacterium]|nr:MAG: hypothetical protein CR972_05210 [Candidatus Moranbacteria bacterium]